MNRRKKIYLGVLTGIFVAAMLGGSLVETGQSRAQSAEAARPIAKDYLQNAVRIYEFKQAADSGIDRGREIYYYKCWICHNEYTVAAGTGAPLIDDLSKRTQLIFTGEPVNKETVARKIREGGRAMPAYQYTLNDQDIADLVELLLSDECCFNNEEQPLNPQYLAK